MYPLASEMRGEDDAETEALREMHQEAVAYLQSHAWCSRVRECRLGFGVGDVIAVFLCRVLRAGHSSGWLWVFVGDLPSAWLNTGDAKDPAEAMGHYVDTMMDWIGAVREGAKLDGMFPVAAPADEEHAGMLESRMVMLREDIIPACRDRLGLDGR